MLKIFCCLTFLGLVPAAWALPYLTYHTDDNPLESMTPIQCLQEGESPEIIALNTSCGKTAICSGEVECLYVSNDSLKGEFGGDEKRALAHFDKSRSAQVKESLGRAARMVSTSWKPKFIYSIENISCKQSESGICSSALNCLKSGNVDKHGKGKWELASGASTTISTGGNIDNRAAE